MAVFLNRYHFPVSLCVLACMAIPTFSITELVVGVLTTWQGGVWKVPQTLLGVIPALDKINSDPNFLPGYNVTFKWSDTQCKTPYALSAALSLIIAGVDVLIGSPCSGDSIEIAPSAWYFNVPMISYYSVSPKLSNKVKYPFFSRVLGTTRTYDAVAIGFLKHFGMKHAAPVYPLDSTFALHWSETMRASLTSADITIDADVAYTSFGDREVNQLTEAGARVVIWLDYNCGRMRSLLFAAHQHNILKGWLWILDAVSTACWKKDDEKDTTLLQAFNGMYSIHPYFFVSQENYDLLDSSKPRLADYIQPLYGAKGRTYGLDEVSVGRNFVGTALLHDAILLWARAAQAVVAKGGSLRDIVAMHAEVLQTTLEGMSGTIVLDENGDRKASAEMKLITINPGGGGLVSKSCAVYDGMSGSFTLLLPEESLVFAGGSRTVPQDFSRNCPSGFYTNTDRLECILCPPGKHASGAQFDRYNCSSCKADTYAPNAGQSECFPCPGFVKSDAGASVCNLCAAGYYKNGSSETEGHCGPCPRGRFSDAVAVTECTLCIPGRYGPNQGGTECQACASGQFADRDGSLDCDPCQPGTYAALQGMSSCEACPAGSFSEQVEQNNCSSCAIRLSGSSSNRASQSFADCFCPKNSYRSDAEGKCVKCGPLHQTEDVGATSSSECHLAPAFYLLLFLPVSGLIFLVLVILALRSYHKAFKRIQEANRVAKITECIESSRDLNFPMAIMTAKHFKSLGRLVSFEEALDKQLLRMLPTVHQVEQFSKRNNIVFFSHQWLGWCEPDPDDVHYSAIVSAIDAILIEKLWTQHDCYVWVDYHSVPQASKPQQHMAIKTLPFFASLATLFVIVAPETTHAGTSLPCNLETYGRRMWCRCEVFAFSCRRGFEDLYKLDAMGDTVSRVEETDILDTILVFEGDCTCCALNHVGMTMCDKEVLRDILIGLYADALWMQRSKSKNGFQEEAGKCCGGGLHRSRTMVEPQEIFSRIADRKELIFPKWLETTFETADRTMLATFSLSRSGTNASSSCRHVKKLLFGDLISTLERMIANNSDDICHLFEAHEDHTLQDAIHAPSHANLVSSLRVDLESMSTGALIRKAMPMAIKPDELDAVEVKEDLMALMLVGDDRQHLGGAGTPELVVL